MISNYFLSCTQTGATLGPVLMCNSNSFDEKCFTKKLIFFLLDSGSTIQNKQMFNIICELPETVARTLVPRMRVVKGSGKAINYLTPPRILLALVTAWVRRGRWFDDKVQFLYIKKKKKIRS